MNFNSKFEMRDVLVEDVTGFKGTVLSISFYDTGCVHYGICGAELKPDGSVHEWQWFDQSRLSLVKAAKKPKPNLGTGGPDKNPKCF